MNSVVRVGVGTIITRDKSILFGLRSSSHGKGCWCFPGGHLEFGETPEECSIRETAEETGLVIKNPSKGPWLNTFFPENGSQYITLFMIAHDEHGDPKILEKDKIIEWKWFLYNALPSPLFLPVKLLLNDGYDFSDCFI